MATIKTPLRIGDDTPEQNFQTGEAVGPEHGGTGKDLTDLAANVGKYPKVNASGTGYDFDTPSGGGGGGGDSLGMGFTAGGGSGVIPSETTATCADLFVIDAAFPSGFQSQLVFSPSGTDIDSRFVGLWHDPAHNFGSVLDAGTDEWTVKGYFNSGTGISTSTLFRQDEDEIRLNSKDVSGTKNSDVVVANAQISITKQQKGALTMDATGVTLKTIGSTFVPGTLTLRAEDVPNSVSRDITIVSDYGTTNMAFQNSNGGFDFNTTTGALIPPRLSTSQRDALTPDEGWTIRNIDDHETQVFNSLTNSWEGLAVPGAGGGGDSLGSGFTDGGGSGIIPAGTIATLEAGGTFAFRYSSGNDAFAFNDVGVSSFSNPAGTCAFSVDASQAIVYGYPGYMITNEVFIHVASDTEYLITDNSANGFGMQYANDQSAALVTNDRSIPDVGTVKLIARPYKVYTALLTQSGTSDPTAIILENSLGGTVTWTRNDAGDYTATLSGGFPADKTWIISGLVDDGDPYNQTPLYLRRVDDNTLSAKTIVAGGGGDGQLVNTSIEIRVYP